jgi:hypothetical protein
LDHEYNPFDYVVKKHPTLATGCGHFGAVLNYKANGRAAPNDQMEIVIQGQSKPGADDRWRFHRPLFLHAACFDFIHSTGINLQS